MGSTYTRKDTFIEKEAICNLFHEIRPMDLITKKILQDKINETLIMLKKYI